MYGVLWCGMWQYVIYQFYCLYCLQGFIVNVDGLWVIDQCGEFFYYQYVDVYLVKVVGYYQINWIGVNDGDLSGMLYGGLNIGCRCCYFQ